MGAMEIVTLEVVEEWGQLREIPGREKVRAE